MGELFALGAAVLGILGLVLFLRGGFFLLSAAADQGFIGIAAFISCWVFFAPVMAVICVLAGLFTWGQ